MHNFLSKAEAERLRKEYPKGTRIELTADMQDPYASLYAGDRATITGVDDAGNLLCKWDSGSTLNILPNIDCFKIVPYVTDTIFQQIMDIRNSGKVNMLDFIAVFEAAIDKDYMELAEFLFSYTEYYSSFILSGRR